MTEDYKDTLLRYISGNLIEQTRPNLPILGDDSSSTSNIGYYLDTNAGSNYEIIDIIQGYQTGYSMIYGNTSNKDGFIAIIDENNNPVQYINQYSSGTLFSEFKLLNVADDGNIYGIDIKSGTPRFIMLNNITLKAPTQSNFIARLRQSYNLPSPLSTATSYFAITKAAGQGKYLIGSTVKHNNKETPMATELTINVGATNDWIDYTYTDFAYNFVGCSIWASWDEDEIDFKIDGYVPRESLYYYQFYPSANVENTLDYNNKELTVDGYANGYYSANTLLTNKDASFVGIFDGGTTGMQEKASIYFYDANTGFLSGAYVNSRTNTRPYEDIPKRIQFKSINGLCFFTTKIFEVYGSYNNLYLTSGIILRMGQGVTVSYDTTVTDGENYNFLFYMTNSYNLYNYNVIGLDYDGFPDTGVNFLRQQVYNANNFNGNPYENTNSLMPNDGILYDSNDIILFARNLYNKSVYGNTTLSVLQIPNTMVNDITIDRQDLMGETKKVLVSNQDDFTKNIFETVYLNFYNTLLIQNRNTPTYITNQYASELLNQSISLAGDYDDMKATKYKINYIDGTNEIHEIQPIITDTSTGKIATYNIQLIIPWNNLAISLQIISEDETTTYQTISTSNLEPGKVYNITQECYVE